MLIPCCLKPICLAAAAVLFIQSARAADPDTADLRRQVAELRALLEKLQARVDELSAQVSPDRTPQPAVAAAALPQAPRLGRSPKPASPAAPRSMP